MAASDTNSLYGEQHVPCFVELRSEGNHTGNDSIHRLMILIKKQNISRTCHMCFEPSDIYCPTCDLSFCNECGDGHQSDQTIGTHEVYNIDHQSTPAVEMPPLEGSSVETPQETVQDVILETGARVSLNGHHGKNSTRGPVPTIKEACQVLIWKLWTSCQDLVSMATPINTTVALFMVMLVTLGVFIHSFPAYTILPPKEVEPVYMICRHMTKVEVYQNKEISKKQAHRTVCTFNVFHYDLLGRNRTYFVLDIDIDIAKTYFIGRDGKLFTVKLFYVNKEHNTYHKQRNMYWSVSRCTTNNDQLALCLEDVNYKKETGMTPRVISKVVLEQTKRVSFLFLVDNEEKRMDIFTPVVNLKDVVFLEHYYDCKTLSVWISLADSKHDKYVTAKIRSGGNVTIGDLPNPAVVTNSQIVHRVMTYPFRSLYVYLWKAFLPLPVQNTNNEQETLDI